MTNSLSGLKNRHGFSVRNQVYPQIGMHSIIAIDIDHSDSCRYHASDRVLFSLAALLRFLSRSGEVVLRFGGEDLIFFLSHTVVAGGLMLAKCVRQTVAALTFPHAERVIHPAGGR
ncbi:diguanylate cyclase (plasmid) [Erwinia pyri]|uniref:Diguanylate cyclase n=1 Tax=Erwinia pyri TaxID=3062598 RepID=A0AA50DNK0_9GAMM|nr:diguanylate cyclase [Erwinia sp. DE2]WLS81100.1 diguanylate cyclase [Erwinia sp. DE2]